MGINLYMHELIDINNVLKLIIDDKKTKKGFFIYRLHHRIKFIYCDKKCVIRFIPKIN